MTMETIDSQQDGSLPDSVAESESAHMQTQTGQNSIPTLAQVATIAETDESAESEGIIDSHKRREILSRRPSYRKILNELSSDVPGVPKIEEEKSEEEGTPPNIAAMAVPTSIYQTSTGQYIAIAQGGTIQISNPGSDGVQGLQALTMTNSGAPPPGATIVQYAAQSADGTQQFFVPGSQVVVQGKCVPGGAKRPAQVPGDRAPARAWPGECKSLIGRPPPTPPPPSLFPGVDALSYSRHWRDADLPDPSSDHCFATGSGDGCLPRKPAQSPAASRGSDTQTGAEANEKQVSFLISVPAVKLFSSAPCVVGEAARECRRKKKEYVKCLENRVAVLENQNKTLIEELKALKDLYCHKAEEAAKECRRRKKEYVKCLESRVAVLEVQNKKLIEELETLKDICSPKTD
ncbi:hypothetical protein MG293_011388 [Ovis ammon polii]|uniref:cAMP-responsive element modulator n=1 Tax=Ovis ammon polii TaxID=230172 RepID=A0AAD4Y522_OVIAM|nr:hypothetical protein MG293_011388 [Ovis ammon polii]